MSSSLTRVARRARSIAVGALLATLVVTGSTRVSGTDPDSAARDLAGDGDFRLKLTAALYLGKAHAPQSRPALEKALNDPHPSVRNAVAMALATLGDPAAIPALERAKGREQSTSVKAQIQSTIDALKKGQEIVKNAHVVVRLGAMSNSSGVRGDALGSVLAVATRTRAAAVSGLVITEDPAIMQQAALKKVPIVILDGAITGLTEGRDKGNVTYRAQVEFTVRKDSTLRGMLRGAATSYDSVAALNDRERVVALQNDAVDGAVQSALKNADQGIARVIKN
jgi:hypothetical protein